MDKGCVVSWEHCYDEECELSAIQHAYNALIDDGPEVFASEFQNEPLSQIVDAATLSADDIAKKQNGYARRSIPQEHQRLTAFIDVQKDVLFYIVAAWSDGFAGSVIDYGTYPDQRRDYFALREVKNKLSITHKGTGFEGSIFAGLQALTNQLFESEWIRDDGTRLAIERCLIDANWGDSTDIVYQFCRQSRYPVIPSHGIYVGASSAPFNDYKPKPGERRGLNWRIPPLAPGRVVRNCTFDANYWKSFVHARFATAIGDRGCLSIFKSPPAKHRLFSEHLTAEYRVQVQAKGRTVDEWKLRPGRENHYLDCLVGAAVAASIQGANLECLKPQKTPARKRREKVAYL